MHGHHNGSAVGPYHRNFVLDLIHAAGIHEIHGTYVDDECFDIHDFDDDTDHDTDDDTVDDTDDDGRGSLYTINVPGGIVCVPKIGSGSLFVARTKNQAFD